MQSYVVELDEHERNAIISALGLSADSFRRHYKKSGLPEATASTLVEVFERLRKRVIETPARAATSFLHPVAPRKIRCLNCGTECFVGQSCPKCFSEKSA